MTKQRSELRGRAATLSRRAPAPVPVGARHALPERWLGRVMLLPLQLLLWAILVVPFLIAIYLSLVHWGATTGIPWWRASFAGISNYAQAVTDPELQAAFLRTLGLVVAAVSLEFVLGIALALVFRGGFPGRRLYFPILLYPMMLPWLMVGLVFYLLFIPTGPVNMILHTLFGSGVDWFGNSILGLLVIMIADVWQWTPFIFLVTYSALGAVPPRTVEAARTLGASEWQIIRRVRLPTIKAVLLIALIIRSLEAFKIFDKIYLMTGGGPGNSTQSISLALYRNALGFGRFSYAAAGAMVVLAFVAAVSWWGVKPLRRAEGR